MNKDFPLEAHEIEYLKAQTGIQDDNELKDHIMKVQADAWKVFPYPCIRGFVFARLKISHLPAYPQLLKIGKERKGAIFLDIGCCFGNDLRKAVADGFPAENAIASDLHAEFLQLGHQLFKTTPGQLPAHFIPGNALDQEFLKTVPPLYSLPETPVPNLSTLTLHGHFSVILASSFFHLFDEPQQLELARALAGLLSPEPGSFIFGEQGAKPIKGYRTDVPPRKDGTYQFCHSPETWSELWDSVVFKKGAVKVEAVLKEIQRKDLTDDKDARFWVMVWSVTRL